MANYLSRFFLQNIPQRQPITQAETDQSRLQILVKFSICLFLLWSIFDYYLDPQNFIFFLSIRIIYTCIAFLLFPLIKKAKTHSAIIKIGMVHIFSVVMSIGIMLFYTNAKNFLAYALGMTMTFIIPSIIMNWKSRFTVIPSLISYFLVIAPLSLTKKDMQSADIVTALFWTGTVLTVSCIFSIISHRYVTQLIDLTNNLQEKVEEKTIELNQKNTELDLKNNELNQKNSELAESNKKLEASNNKLQDLDKRKNEFLANTSHELRTPLHGIMGMTQYLLKILQHEISEDQLDNLTLIHQSGTRLNYLINDILDFSKMRDNNVELMLTEVNIPLLMKNLLVLLTPQMTHQNLVLINQLPDELPKVLADENRMQQILYNLLGNALKFTPKGFIRIYAEVEQGLLKIFIADTGIGIPSHKLDLIFEAFEQVDGSKSRKYGGAGLGLSVTKKLVELHQGSIGVKSSMGKGSCFYFSVPLATGLQVQYPSAYPPSMQLIESPLPEFIAGKIHPQMQQSFQHLQLLPKATVLAVDDDGLNIRVTKNFLTSIGARVITANSGKTALSLLHNLCSKPIPYVTEVKSDGNKASDSMAQSMPDLILLDVMMPGMNGYEVAAMIRATISKTLPIVILTALKEDTEALHQGFIAGVNDFLSKPYDETELFMRLESVLHSQTFLKAQRKTEELA